MKFAERSEARIQTLGISRAEVEQAIDAPDAVEALYFARDSRKTSPPVTLYVRQPGQGNSRDYLLVLSSTGLTAPEAVIEDAWRVPQRWFEGHPRPIEIMEELCRRAGCRITFGRIARTFYGAFEEPFEGETLSPDIDSPPLGETSGRMFAMVTPNNHLRIGLAYMINDLRYQAAIAAT